MKKVIVSVSFLLGLSVLFSSCEKSGTENGKDDEGESDAPGAVDLGLSVKWASCNLGASKPEEFGDYFAWGEVSPKSTDKYNFKYYRFSGEGKLWTGGRDMCTLTKYNTKSEYGVVDNKTQLDLEDDAAHVILGGKWRMPTKDEWEELYNNCTLSFRKSDKCLILTSKINGNSIIFPEAGEYSPNWKIYNGTSTFDDCETGDYWSSSLCADDPYNAWCLGWEDHEDFYFDAYYYRCAGSPIRPVMGK